VIIGKSAPELVPPEETPAPGSTSRAAAAPSARTTAASRSRTKQGPKKRAQPEGLVESRLHHGPGVIATDIGRAMRDLYREGTAPGISSGGELGMEKYAPPAKPPAKKKPEKPEKKFKPTFDPTGLDHPEAQVLMEMGFTPERVKHLAKTHAPEHPAASEVGGGGASKEQGAGTPTGGLVAVAQGINDFLGAVKTHESGGDYAANSGDGAYGAYQYTPSTWNSMAAAAGYPQYANGRADLAPPAVQDAVARYNAAQQYKTYGGNFGDMAQAWYDPAYVGDNSYAPPGNNGLTMGQYATDITNLMGQGAGTSGVVDPAGAGLTQGRTDQGVDWSGSGPLYATGAGKIVDVATGDSGWPGGTFIEEQLANPPDPQHQDVYYAEDIAPGVTQGQEVSAGQQVGEATGGPSGIELGWGNPAAPGQPLNQVTQGPYAGEGATPQGQSFLNYITGGSAGAGDTMAGASDPYAGTTTGTTDPNVSAGAQALSDASSANMFQGLANLIGGSGNAVASNSLQQALSGLSASPEAGTEAANTQNNPGNPNAQKPASTQVQQAPQLQSAAAYQALLSQLLPGIAPGSAGKGQ
jgi:hypothetical protein